MGEKTSHRRINHKVKDPLINLKDEDTLIVKGKFFKPGRRRNDEDWGDEESD
jgi:hypothetical protein